MKRSCFQSLVALVMTLCCLLLGTGCQHRPPSTGTPPALSGGSHTPRTSTTSTGDVAPDASRQTPLIGTGGAVTHVSGQATPANVGVCLTANSFAKAGAIVNGWYVNGPSNGWYVLNRPGSEVARHILVPFQDADAEAIAQKVDGQAHKIGQGSGAHILVAGDIHSARYQQVVNALTAKGYNVDELDISGLSVDDALTAVADGMEHLGTQIATIVTDPDQPSTHPGSGGRRKTPKRPRRQRRPPRQRDSMSFRPNFPDMPPPGYSPEPPVGGSLPGVMPGGSVAGIDLSEMSLTYVSGHPSGTEQGEFGELFRAPLLSATNPTPGLLDRADELRTAFRIGLALQPERFWVNLNPHEPDRVIDEHLGMTDVGQIMLLADLQLKKDVALITDPRNGNIGREYWHRLTRAAGDTSEIRQQTRNWIVPGTNKIQATGDYAVLIEANLEVRSEVEYLAAKSGNSLSTSMSDRIFNEMVLPRLQQRVNTAIEYAPLRRIYRSLVLARWYRDRYRDTTEPEAKDIDTDRVYGLKSRTSWHPRTIWQHYLNSVQHGEYDFTESTEQTIGNIRRVKITRYFSGGIDFSDIPAKAHDIEPAIHELITAARKPGGALHDRQLWFAAIPLETTTSVPHIVRTGNKAQGNPQWWILPLLAICCISVFLAFLVRNRWTHSY